MCPPREPWAKTPKTAKLSHLDQNYRDEANEIASRHAPMTEDRCGSRTVLAATSAERQLPPIPDGLAAARKSAGPCQ